jgi:hypothetical protein
MHYWVAVWIADYQLARASINSEAAKSTFELLTTAYFFYYLYSGWQWG